MASPSELSLECKPHSFSMLLKSFGEQSEQTQKLEDYLARLEEERLKIDAFKRELPLCMQLLTQEVEVSKKQLQSYKANLGQKPVLEEFIPLKHSKPDISEAKQPNNSDKANWMTSAQLWSQAGEATKQQSTTLTPPKETSEIGFNVSPNLTLDTKRRNGGAFLPFSKETNSSISDLALNSADKEIEDSKCLETENGISCPRGDNHDRAGNGSEQGKGSNNSSEAQTTINTTTTTQPHRKARRCWSPDLHRRFVNALQMLGGSQVATPKQIRELMKVDGLTNDEVKSHLQKYRLHTRRPSPSPQAAAAAAPQLVVLGGIWVPPEYATAATHGGAPSIYSSGHYCTPPVPQEFYAAPPPAALPQHQLHHNSLHHQHLQVYKGVNHMQSLPESDMRVGGERSESIEDGKSESSSEDRKELARRREDGEDSNGSEITLKF